MHIMNMDHNMSVCITGEQSRKQHTTCQIKRTTPSFMCFYLVGAYWGAAVLRLRGGEEGLPLWAQPPGSGSHRSEPPWAAAALSLTAASVLAGGSVEAPREAGNGRQLAAGCWQAHVCHCCCWTECWCKCWYWYRQVGAGLNRS